VARSFFAKVLFTSYSSACFTDKTTSSVVSPALARGITRELVEPPKPYIKLLQSDQMDFGEFGTLSGFPENNLQYDALFQTDGLLACGNLRGFQPNNPALSHELPYCGGFSGYPVSYQKLLSLIAKLEHDFQYKKIFKYTVPCFGKHNITTLMHIDYNSEPITVIPIKVKYNSINDTSEVTGFGC
jgi:hypothetical protein